ncbi:MAG: hypothetical protein GYA87_03665 [Christensenellaceae bacterium]|nr:hypothetical protein [Christensenellaceae bacterium]
MEQAFDPAQIARDFETQFSSEEKQELVLQAKNINIKDSLTISAFGAQEQRELSDVSDMLLKRASGTALEDAVAAINDLQEQIASLDIVSLGSSKGFFAKLFSSNKRKYNNLRRDYTEITFMVDRLSNQIGMARLALLKEIGLLDTLYDSNLKYYRALERKIIIGEQALAIAQQEKSIQDKQESFLFSERLNQLRQSKTVSLQLAVQIRLTQHNQKLVVEKLKQITEVALPLWKSQLALALNIKQQQEALGAYREAAQRTVEVMGKTEQALKDGKGLAAEEGENILTELERLKDADFQLKLLMEETISSAQKAKNQG